MKLVATFIFLITLSAKAATYYVNGSMGQLAPGMPGSGVYGHDNDIYFLTGTFPSNCFPWNITNANIFAGTNGSTYVNPIFDAQSNDLHLLATNGMVIQSATNMTLCGITFTNIYGGMTNGSAAICVNLNNQGGGVITNCQFGNLIVAGGTNDCQICVLGETSQPGNPYSKVTHCSFSGLPASTNVGAAAYYCETFEYNTVSYMPNGFVGAGATNQFNLYQHIHASANPSGHYNAMLSLGNFLATRVCRGNIIDDSSAENLYFNVTGPGENIYVYDNLVYGLSGNAPAILLDPENGYGGSFFCYNNTLQSMNSESYIRIALRGTNMIASVNATNNFFIGSGEGGVVPDMGVTTPVAEGNELTNTVAVAAAAGYVAPLYGPSSSASPTVRRGLNVSAIVTTDGLGRATTLPMDIGWLQLQIGIINLLPGNTINFGAAGPGTNGVNFLP